MNMERTHRRSGAVSKHARANIIALCLLPVAAIAVAGTPPQDVECVFYYARANPGVTSTQGCERQLAAGDRTTQKVTIRTNARFNSGAFTGPQWATRSVSVKRSDTNAVVVTYGPLVTNGNHTQEFTLASPVTYPDVTLKVAASINTWSGTKATVNVAAR